MISGKGYKTRLLNLNDEIWDRRLGINTFGYRPEVGSSDDANWRVHYTPASYSSIFHALAYVGLDRSDTFTDLGSGMGRAVFAASWLGASRAQGVEILPDLYEIAEGNRRRSRLTQKDISFVCADARAVDLGSTTVLFMFHPFGADTLKAVLSSLEKKRAKGLRIVYVNPVFSSTMQDLTWLSLDCVMRPPRSFFAQSRNWNVAIWRAKD